MARASSASNGPAVAVLCALLLWPGAPAADSDPVATALTLINQMRGEQGLTPLTLERRVGLAATGHAHAMAEQDFFGHVGPDGLQIGERLTRAGYVWSLAAENIAAGTTTARETVRTWIDSPRHRANLLLEGARHAGIGHVRVDPDPGSVVFKDYWVLMIAAPGPQ